MTCIVEMMELLVGTEHFTGVCQSLVETKTTDTRRSQKERNLQALSSICTHLACNDTLAPVFLDLVATNEQDFRAEHQPRPDNLCLKETDNRMS